MVSTTILNDEILERGFILHIIHVYPEVATQANYPSVTEMFFGMKPLLDLLTFTEVKVIRDSIRDRLGEVWVPFCLTRLSSAAQDYIKEKLMNFASADQVPVPNRKRLYELLESLGETSEPVASGNPLIHIKTAGGSRLGSHSAQGHQNGSTSGPSASSTHVAAVKPVGESVKARKQKLNQAIKDKKAMNVLESELSHHSEVEAQTQTGTVVSVTFDASPSKPTKLNKSNAKGVAQQRQAASSSSAHTKKDVMSHALESIIGKVRTETEGKPLEEVYQLIGVTEEEYACPEEMDMSELTYEQLRQKLPAYMFMAGKRRVKYFKKIMSDYTNKLKEQPSKEKTQRVQFDKTTPVSRVKSRFVLTQSSTRNTKWL